MTYASLAYPLQVCKNCYQSVMNIVLVILLLLMLRNLYACSSNVLSTNTVTTQLLFLSGNQIDFVQEVKYLGVLLNPSMKTSIDVSRQTRKFYVQANMLLRIFGIVHVVMK